MVDDRSGWWWPWTGRAGGGGQGSGIPRVLPDGGHGREREETVVRGEREAVLADLYESSRELMVAETQTAIGSIAVETVEEVFSLPVAALYLDEDGLVAVQATSEGSYLLDRPTPAPVEAAYEQGTVVFGGQDDDHVVPAENAGLAVPLGDHGVLAAGTAEGDRLSARTVEYAQLLAANVEAALNRATRETLLRERERELRESREKITRLHEAATSIVACRDEEALYRLAIATAEEVLDLEMCAILVREGEWLVPAARSTDAPEDGVRKMGLDEGLAGESYRTGDPQLADDLAADEDATPATDLYRSGFSVPVGDYGVFQAVATEVAAFGQRDVEFAELLMSHVEETVRRIRAERDLRESEAKFREIAENVESIVWMTDPEREEALYVSPAFERVWGRSAEAVDDPAALLQWIHEDDREHVRETATENPGEYDLQYRICRPDGEVRWVHDRAFPITEDGELIRVVGLMADVTERKRREEELGRYETVFETVQDRVYVLDERGCFDMVNDPLLDMIGYDREAVLGEHVSLLLDDEAVGRLQATSAKLAETDRRAETLEVTVETADGERVPCETDVAVLPSDEGFQGTVGVLRDITDRKRVEAALRHERDRLSVLFENIPDPVVETGVDESGEPRIQSVNPAFEEVFGVEASEVRADPLADHILPPEASPGESGLWECVETETAHQEEVRRRTDDGIGHFLLRGIPFETGPEGIEGSYGIYTDISEQKRRQRQLQVLNRVLRHNLRNDMNKIIGYADLLSVDLSTGEKAHRASVIRETADGLVNLSEKVRQIGTVLDEDADTGDPIDVVSLLEGLLRPYRNRADVAVVTDLPDAQLVDADARLQLALENLLDNAVEHSDRECPTVTVELESVDADHGEWVDVVVADDGPGIPSAERTVLTEEREITKVEHGSGLGLWLVNWVVTSLGGDVSLADNEPRGSEITVRLRAVDHDE